MRTNLAGNKHNWNLCVSDLLTRAAGGKRPDGRSYRGHWKKGANLIRLFDKALKSIGPDEFNVTSGIVWAFGQNFDITLNGRTYRVVRDHDEVVFTNGNRRMRIRYDATEQEVTRFVAKAFYG